MSNPPDGRFVKLIQRRLDAIEELANSITDCHPEVRKMCQALRDTVGTKRDPLSVAGIHDKVSIHRSLSYIEELLIRRLDATEYPAAEPTYPGARLDASGFPLGHRPECLAEAAAHAASIPPPEAIAAEDSWDSSIAEDEGWIIIDVDSTGWLEIEKLDEATEFESDQAAEDFVKRRAASGSAYHIEALNITAEAQRRMGNKRPSIEAETDNQHQDS